MPTMGEAARLLGIGRVTLEKWCKRLDLTPERHPYDYRYFTLTEEQVDAIRAARRQMPSASSTWREPPPMPPLYPSLSARSALRAKSERGGYSGTGGGGAGGVTDSVDGEARPSGHGAHSPQQETLRAHPLPAGWMAVSTFCRRHGLYDRSVLRELAMPTPLVAPEGQPWGSKSARSSLYQPVLFAYRAEELTRACQVAAAKWPARWRPCPDCPHT